MQSSCLILSNLLNLPPIFFFNSLWFSIVFSNEISRTHVLLSLQRGYLQWRKFPRGDFPEQRLSIPSETRLVGRKLIRAGREKKREKRDGERPEATKLLYPTFILLFPASSPRAASISPGPFPFRDARENNLESTLVVAVKLHPKLQRQRHRKPIQRRTTARDIFPPFHASSSPPLCSALLALWIVWRWRVMAGPGARKPPRGPRIGRSSAVGDVREDESSCLPNSCSLSLSFLYPFRPRRHAACFSSLSFSRRERDFIDVSFSSSSWFFFDSLSGIFILTEGSLIVCLVS